MFNLSAVRYTLRDRSLDIYISGCLGDNGVHCKNCHNPQLWDPNFGRPWETYKDTITESIEKAGDLVQSIRIYGGEPLEKPETDLLELISFIQGFNLPIWLFTRFELESVPKRILESLDYIKCGPYDESQKGEVTYYGVTLATLNQVIYKKGKDF
jgi:organic radical activating enzyme